MKAECQEFLVILSLSPFSVFRTSPILLSCVVFEVGWESCYRLDDIFGKIREFGLSKQEVWSSEGNF